MRIAPARRASGVGDRRKLLRANLTWDVLHVDRCDLNPTRQGLAASWAGADPGDNLVIASFGRLTADEGELVTRTKELVVRDISLDVGGVVLRAATDDGRPRSTVTSPALGRASVTTPFVDVDHRNHLVRLAGTRPEEATG